ncbi:MAG: group III truncated hemoglobin [Bacteroidetes Order II. Incertae sedis bacterium]|nr:group III truncated hemoglobin [Bacteroidetes Order II. bacterium]
MQNDIQTSDDIRYLVEAFYAQVRQDAVIRPHFEEIAKINWSLHLPKMYAFWEAVIFGKAGYKGDPMAVHIQLDQKKALTAAHFERWMAIWQETLHTNFKGQNTEKALKQAQAIQALMQHKINSFREPTEDIGVI